MNIVKARLAFGRQCWDAKKRGIAMQFTFEEWCQWWENKLGPNWQSRRGAKRGQFVMARKGDKGPYSIRNVRLLTVTQNHQEYNSLRLPPTKKQQPKLPKEMVASIFTASGTYKDIATACGVTVHRVHCIKTKKYYRSITDEINR